MRKVGLTIDSSVYPGGKEIGELSQYNYETITNDKGYWYIDEDVTIEEKEKTNLVEMQIVAFPMRRIFKFLSLERIQSVWRNKKSAKDSFEAKTSTRSKLSKIEYLLQYEWQTWDFCLFSNSMHRNYIKQCNELHLQKQRDYFVVIGHPKSLVTTKSLEFLLRSVKQNAYSFEIISKINWY
jgi:hypothetical protein